MPVVLVVDDSATMRKIIIKCVKEAGVGDCEFVQAADGVEGLEALIKNEVDLVLSDVNMPNMDGIQFVRCVRDEKALEATSIGNKELLRRVGKSIPIVMITTDGSPDQVQEALSAGANDYLKKPFTPEQLKKTLTPLLG